MTLAVLGEQVVAVERVRHRPGFDHGEIAPAIRGQSASSSRTTSSSPSPRVSRAFTRLVTSWSFGTPLLDLLVQRAQLREKVEVEDALALDRDQHHVIATELAAERIVIQPDRIVLAQETFRRGVEREVRELRRERHR